MELQNKIENILIDWIEKDYDRQHVANIIEIELDKKSTEFAEWVSYKCKFLENKGWFGTSFQLEMGIFKTSEELLEEFKKEKRL